MVEVIIHHINSNEQRNETLSPIDNTQNPDRQKFKKAFDKILKNNWQHSEKYMSYQSTEIQRIINKPFNELSTQITLKHS